MLHRRGRALRAIATATIFAAAGIGACDRQPVDPPGEVVIYVPPTPQGGHGFEPDPPRVACQPDPGVPTPNLPSYIEEADPVSLPDHLEAPQVCADDEVPVPVAYSGPKGRPQPKPARAYTPGGSELMSAGGTVASAVPGERIAMRRVRGLLSPARQWVNYYYATMFHEGTFYGTGVVAEVRKPMVNDYGHSLFSLAAIQGELGGAFDAVEIGWRVAPAHYGSGQPHLFVFHWAGGKPSCYDLPAEPSAPTCGWVQVSKTIYPGLPLANGKELTLMWLYHSERWWARVGNQFIGFFPEALFDSFPTADQVHWFGEVAESVLPWNEMGSGFAATQTQASWFRAPCLIAGSAPASCQVLIPPPPYLISHPYSQEVPPPLTPNTYRYGGP